VAGGGVGWGGGEGGGGYGGEGGLKGGGRGGWGGGGGGGEREWGSRLEERGGTLWAVARRTGEDGKNRGREEVIRGEGGDSSSDCWPQW